MLDFDFIDFLDPFTWDKNIYKFNRGEKDMHPYSIVNNEKVFIIVHNILGVDKKDLEVSIKPENNKTYLSIEGKTKDIITTKEYSVSSRFELDVDQLDLTKVSSTMNNGLLYITFVKKPRQPKLNAINIEIK